MFEIPDVELAPRGRTTMIRDTGSPRADAEADFLRARRLQVHRRADRPPAAQGERRPQGAVVPGGRRRAGPASTRSPSACRSSRWTQIVGSVDRVREFDPKFRPRTGLSRRRFERIDEAVRRGQPLPPIDVYQVGDIYFVRDGHHRVAVHRALDLPEIEADVRLVRTVVEPDDVRAHSDLAARELRRLFLQRVPVGRPGRRAARPQRPGAVPVVRGDGRGLGRAADVRRGAAAWTVPRPRGAGTPRSSCPSSR